MNTYIYNYNPNHFKYGCLEPKAKVEKPIIAEYEYFTSGKLSKQYYVELEQYEADQARIEQGRIEVSEEWNSWFVETDEVFINREFIKDTDFTVRDGKAYPVKNKTLWFVEEERTGEWAINKHNWTRDPSKAAKFNSENEAVEYIINSNLLNCKPTEHEFVGYVADNIYSEIESANDRITSLQSENERLKGEDNLTREQNLKLSQNVHKLKEQIQSIQSKLDKARERITKIADWELPETGKYWDEEKTRPLTYEAAYGSNGVRDYMKKLASETLKEIE